jgi:transposase-like protein
MRRKPQFPRTREHTAQLVSRKPLTFRCSQAGRPSSIERWATDVLERAGVKAQSEAHIDLLEYKIGDPVLQDIAWCLLHAHDAVSALATIPESHKTAALRACVDMYEAGKRHESFDEYQKHAPAIAEREARERQRAKAREKSAESRRIITEAAYARVDKPGRTVEEKAEALGVSPQALRRWLRKTQEQRA